MSRKQEAVAWKEIARHPTGSRYICNPPVTDTDDDWVVLVEDINYARFIAGRNGWYQAEADTSYGRAGEEDTVPTFSSMRHNTESYNYIFIQDPEFYDRYVAATELAKHYNLLKKPDRIQLFHAVLYGEYIEPPVVQRLEEVGEPEPNPTPYYPEAPQFVERPTNEDTTPYFSAFRYDSAGNREDLGMTADEYAATLQSRMDDWRRTPGGWEVSASRLENSLNTRTDSMNILAGSRLNQVYRDMPPLRGSEEAIRRLLPAEQLEAVASQYGAAQVREFTGMSEHEAEWERDRAERIALLRDELATASAVYGSGDAVRSS